MITAKQLQAKFIEFFKEHKHAIIPSASLIPENDPTVLFTTAGMHPLVPFFLEQTHPKGKRLANAQKCLRTNDIDSVGDPSHNTFFFMLGSWSFGDYFKKEAIEMSWEFLTSKKWLALDKSKLSVTVFAGDSDAPKDEESIKTWKSLGVPENKIFQNGKKDNWWGPAGETGPCGPDTEMFFDTGKEKCGPNCVPGCGCGKYFEIWNDVFMEYNKTKDGKYEKLKKRSVDTGMGLERTAAMLQGKDSIYDTEMFQPIIKKINSLCSGGSFISKRIVADHLRAAVFVLSDPMAVVPSNLDRGYILRRLIRRAIRHGRLLGIKGDFCAKIAEVVIETYDEWPELKERKKFVVSELTKEEERFNKTLDKGLRELSRICKENKKITANDAFLVFQSYGFPLEMTVEVAEELGFHVEKEEFEKEFAKHQELSRKGAEKKFKSGLADTGEQTVKLHTATHLLHAALRKVLGDSVKQRGSNITAERLRFDFSYPEKVTSEQLKEVEKIVNDQISKSVPVKREEKSIDEAKKEGAVALFDEKYGGRVSVYTIAGFSKEVCTGPHVSNTKELGKFKILKEEAVSAGVRRIKAVVG